MIKRTVWELNEPFVGHEGTGGVDVTDEHGQRVGVINVVDGRVFTANGRLRFVGARKPAFASWTEQSGG
jgi:hypothetical protein